MKNRQWGSIKACRLNTLDREIFSLFHGRENDRGWFVQGVAKKTMG